MIPRDLPWTVWAPSLAVDRPMFHRTTELHSRPAGAKEASMLGISPQEGQRATVWTTNCGAALYGYLEAPPFDRWDNGKVLRYTDRGASISTRHAVQITAARWCRRCWPEATG